MSPLSKSFITMQGIITGPARAGIPRDSTTKG